MSNAIDKLLVLASDMDEHGLYEYADFVQDMIKIVSAQNVDPELATQQEKIKKLQEELEKNNTLYMNMVKQKQLTLQDQATGLTKQRSIFQPKV